MSVYNDLLNYFYANKMSKVIVMTSPCTEFERFRKRLGRVYRLLHPHLQL
jgi:hypothetical protein